jgi:hypothetical protein
VPLVEQKFIVALCPVCGNRVGYSDEGGYNVFSSRKEAREIFAEMVEPIDGDTVEGRIAALCQNPECERAYRHRHCKEHPCGYCKGKQQAAAGQSEKE